MFVLKVPCKGDDMFILTSSPIKGYPMDAPPPALAGPSAGIIGGLGVLTSPSDLGRGIGSFPFKTRGIWLSRTSAMTM